MAPVPPDAAKSRTAMTEEELARWGAALGRALTPPVLLAVSGELGAGKTTLIRAICRGYGVGEDVTSPTFTLVHRYRADLSAVYHLDLYRLRSPAELTQIGWDDLLAETAVVIVEWPERAGDRLPAVHLPISLEHIEGDAERRFLYAGGHVGADSFGGQEA
jgi:tRNA threonylcarbamoyladenosine biosynthesis protein TsaE